MRIPVRLPDLEYWKSQVACQAGCPVSTDAGRYVQLIAEGRDEEAFLVARAPNPFASVCGRVCAAPCEDACRRGVIDAPVSIRALKRFVTEKFGVESSRPDTQNRLFREPIEEGNRYAGHLPFHPSAGAARASSRKRFAKRSLDSGGTRGSSPLASHAADVSPHSPSEETPGLYGSAGSPKVAVIGSGPAGLSAAHDLALLGYAVTVFEAADEPGGAMRLAIPADRLPRDLLREEIRRIVSLGVEIRLQAPLTPEFGLAELRAAGFEAVFLSVGLPKGRSLTLPGAGLPGVVTAVDYLRSMGRGLRVDLGRNVLVIGAGFVAVDAARSALHSGAATATIVALEEFREVPELRTAQGREGLEAAMREGIRFLPRRAPRRFLGESRLAAVELKKVVAVFDGNGRFSPAYDETDLVTIEATGCVLAIGQRADLAFLRAEDGVGRTPDGAVSVDPGTLATTAPGVFAGGDVAFGPRTLIEAVGNGKRAARSIHELLSRRRAEAASGLLIEKLPTRAYRMIAGYERLDRDPAPRLEPGLRTGRAEVESVYDERTARRQAARCLVCHVQTIYDPERCVLCGRCVDVCPEGCLAMVPFGDLDLPEGERAALEAGAPGGGRPLSAMLKDDARCIRCGLCAVRCPTDALTMERFSVTEGFVPPPRHLPGSSRRGRKHAS
jgi:formate dehydrogenase beta subunit